MCKCANWVQHKAQVNHSAGEYCWADTCWAKLFKGRLMLTILTEVLTFFVWRCFSDYSNSKHTSIHAVLPENLNEKLQNNKSKFSLIWLQYNWALINHARLVGHLYVDQYCLFIWIINYILYKVFTLPFWPDGYLAKSYYRPSKESCVRGGKC